MLFFYLLLFFLLVFALIYRNLGFFLILENTKFFFRPRIFGKSIFAAALNKIKYSIKFGFFRCLVIALRLLSFWSVTHVSVAKISTMQKKGRRKRKRFWPKESANQIGLGTWMAQNEWEQWSHQAATFTKSIEYTPIYCCYCRIVCTQSSIIKNNGQTRNINL